MNTPKGRPLLAGPDDPTTRRPHQTQKAEVTVTTQITEPAVASVDSIRRNSYMAALSLAEQIMSVSTALPTDFQVAARPWTPDAPELRFYFHHDVPGLRQFRDDQQLAETVVRREDGSVYIEATREDVRGVRVVAWTLSDAEAPAVAA